MDEHVSRSHSGDHPRSTTEQEWEVFCRESTSEPLQHVGSVTAPSTEIAHEQAEQLFGRFARDLWLCPADTVQRYSVTSPSSTATESTANHADIPTSNR